MIRDNIDDLENSSDDFDYCKEEQINTKYCHVFLKHNFDKCLLGYLLIRMRADWDAADWDVC